MRQTNDHRGERYRTSSQSYWIVCSCGWLSSPSRDRDDVDSEFARHAPGASVQDAEGAIQTGESTTERPDRPTAGSGRMRHERLRSERVQLRPGEPRFRARCSCGWTSDPVEMALSFAVWDDHLENTRGPRAT